MEFVVSSTGKTVCMTMTTTTLKNMNLPLPSELHEALFAESREMGVPTTRLVRRVLEDWLHERGRARRREEIRDFAQACAGTELDLDPDLEAEAAEELQRLYEGEDETR